MGIIDFEQLIKEETTRQQESLDLIPSENYPSRCVQEAVGSLLMAKYAEGYPGKRYYQGGSVVDVIEESARELAKSLFGVVHANVQPYSGSIANSAVQMALLKPGQTLMGMSLSGGGHLTHGHPKITFSGSIFKSVQYDVSADGLIDYDLLAEEVQNLKPEMIIAGTTAYPRILDWKRFAEIADGVGAWLVADISHIAGLVVGGVHPSPVNYAHVVTTTTHKTLRGPRGAMILVTQKGSAKDEELPKLIDRAVFPGLQGGPHMNVIAGIGLALQEAGTSEFAKYAKQIVANSVELSRKLQELGFRITTGGTDNHLMVIDLQKNGMSGKEAAVLLEQSGVVVNANTIPHDPNPPGRPSGIRLGTPAVTTRGMETGEMDEIARIIYQVLVEKKAANDKVAELVLRFPLKV